MCYGRLLELVHNILERKKKNLPPEPENLCVWIYIPKNIWWLSLKARF